MKICESGKVNMRKTETGTDTSRLAQKSIVLMSVSVQHEDLHTILYNPFYIGLGIGKCQRIIIMIFVSHLILASFTFQNRFKCTYCEQTFETHLELYDHYRLVVPLSWYNRVLPNDWKGNMIIFSRHNYTWRQVISVGTKRGRGSQCDIKLTFVFDQYHHSPWIAF